MTAVEFCDIMQRLGRNRLGALEPGSDGAFMLEVQKEFERRGFEVHWFNKNTEMTWHRPDGYVSHRDCFLECTMMILAYESLANSPTSDIYTVAPPERLSRAVGYLKEQLSDLATPAAGDHKERLGAIRERCDQLLADS